MTKFKSVRKIKRRHSMAEYAPGVTAQIKKDLAAGQPVVGTMFLNAKATKMVHKPLVLAKKLGYRFVIIDCEHNAWDNEKLADYAEKSHRIGLSLWIRTAQLNEVPISRYLDMGFSGCIVVNCIDKDRLIRAIDQAYFDPIADPKAFIRRGYCIGPLLLDGQKFNTFSEEIKYVNENTILIPQIEHPQGIANLEWFLEKDGVDATFVGMNDMSLNLAREPENSDLLRNPKSEMYKNKILWNALERIGEISKKKRKPSGVHIVNIAQLDLANLFVDKLGYKLMILGTESNFFTAEMLSVKREMENKKPWSV